jgi:hypothetical protein
MSNIRVGLWRAWVAISIAWVAVTCAIYGPGFVDDFDRNARGYWAAALLSPPPPRSTETA